jgi:hypothetical protein
MGTDKKSEVPMSSIDLLDYTNTKKKIPQDLLLEKKDDHPLNFTKIIGAYFLDAMMIFQTTIIMSFIFQLSFKTLMVSESLVDAFDSIPFISLTWSTIPLIAFSYYFFSFFFNHGQTWGMHSVKSRIDMKELELKDSFLWAAKLSLITLSGTFLIFAFYPQLRTWSKKHFKSHDHLYSHLIKHKDYPPINLLKEIDQIHQFEGEVIEETKKAA